MNHMSSVDPHRGCHLRLRQAGVGALRQTGLCQHVPVHPRVLPGCESQTQVVGSKSEILLDIQCASAGLEVERLHEV